MRYAVCGRWYGVCGMWFLQTVSSTMYMHMFMHIMYMYMHMYIHMYIMYMYIQWKLNPDVLYSFLNFSRRLLVRQWSTSSTILQRKS